MSQYSHIAKQRATAEQAIDDCQAYRERTKCRVRRILVDKRQTDGTHARELRFQAFALGKLKLNYHRGIGGRTASCGVRKPGDTVSSKHAGVYVENEGGEFIEVGDQAETSL